MLESEYGFEFLMTYYPSGVKEAKKEVGWKAWLKQFKIVMYFLRVLYPSKFNEEYVVSIE